VWAVAVAWKLSSIEVQRHDQSCLFRREDYIDKDQIPEKAVLGSIPCEDCFVAWKLIMTEEQGQGKICLFR
jgi:hypothetical protein